MLQREVAPADRGVKNLRLIPLHRDGTAEPSAGKGPTSQTGPGVSGPAQGSAGDPAVRRSPPVRTYLMVLVAIFIFAAAGSAAYVRAQANHDAQVSATADASFGATKAADAIGKDLATLVKQVSHTAATPGLSKVFAAPQACTLTFAGLSVFPSGHLDLINAAGSDACTSLPRAQAPSDSAYAGMDWLRQALLGPVLTGPLIDPVTKEQVLVSASPIPGGGVVAGFLNLGSLGSALSSSFGGQRGLEFLVATNEATTALARSIDPARWTGSNLTGTPFARALTALGTSPTPAAATLPDVDGRERLYASASIQAASPGSAPATASAPTGGGANWVVFAGADRSAALASAAGLYHRNVAIILVGLVASLLASLFVYRRLGIPIRQLGAAVRAAGAHTAPGPIDVDGPAEVVALAGDFQRLIATVDKELNERLRAQSAAEASERSYRLLFQNNPLPMWVYDSETQFFLEVNDAAVSLYGYSREQFMSLKHTDLLLPEDQGPPPPDADGGPLPGEPPWRHIKRDGSLIDVSVLSYRVTFAGRDALFVMVEDLTERSRLEKQLRQSQRLETVGQLAGGVAHDFNNLLGVILNYTTFVDRELAASGDARWQRARDDLTEITGAANRATRLTRQLLTFARRGVVRPEVIDVNRVIEEVEKLLGRTLGEHVMLTGTKAPDVRPVLADTGQIEQVLINLAVNARDAMPTGGTLTIDTDNVVVDQTYSDARPGLRPGLYTRIRVGDTGEGMDRHVLEHVFEPFFTTKGTGKGTGLGLATVYGIVTQANGHVHIYSEPGLGTTVSILLPATDQAPLGSADVTETRSPEAGSTILVVEDEDALRQVTRRILENNGFHVLTAADAAEALEEATQHPGRIDLVLTDVIMPQVLGQDLASSLVALRPDIRVIYMSGYAQPFLASTGTLKQGVLLIEKPFSEAVLLDKICDALADQPAGDGAESLDR